MDNRIDAIYGRQSIDKKDSISIESQFEFCRYELKGGEAKEYKDKGYSGKNIERPDFQRLLQDIRLGLIKRVIVYKLDRISRSIVDFAKLMELFKQYDVAVSYTHLDVYKRQVVVLPKVSEHLIPRPAKNII